MSHGEENKTPFIESLERKPERESPNRTISASGGTVPVKTLGPEGGGL